MNRNRNVKESFGSKLFDVVNVLLMLLLILITLYPFWYVGVASLSNPALVINGDVVLYPKGFTFDAYERVFADDTIWRSYWNTIRYTITQTAFTVFFTALTAYPLSKKRLIARRPLLMAAGFTLLFSGGLIPSFLVVKSLGMYNTMWALIIPGAVNTFYLFIMRTFFEAIPEELEDAATIDGCGSFGTLIRVVMPLSMPVLVTVGLFTAVAQWNAFFGALIYLSDKNLYPLQIFLRNVVISGSAASQAAKQGEGGDEVVIIETIKYATVMVATLPIICVYPFIQKYFIQGAMIGGIKG